MSGTVPQPVYDAMLDSVLAEVGLTHGYISFLRKKPTNRVVEAFDDHLIIMQQSARFLGILPYQRRIEVGRIRLEPESAKPYTNGHFLRYGESMQIYVTNPRAEETFEKLGQKLSKTLGTMVEILPGY